MPAIINSDDGVVSGSSGLKTSGANDGITVFQQNGTESMRIDSSGNITVKDKIQFGTDPQTNIQAGGTSDVDLIVAGDTNIRFETATNERMRIDSSGNVGISTSSPLATLDVNGTSLFRNTQYTYQPAPTALTGNTTLSAAQILTQIITTSSGAITLTMPTGSTLDSGLPASFPNDGAFDFTIIDTDAGQTTLNGNTGVTIVGSGAVGSNSSGRFRLRKTGTATYIVYRLA